MFGFHILTWVRFSLFLPFYCFTTISVVKTETVSGQFIISLDRSWGSFVVEKREGFREACEVVGAEKLEVGYLEAEHPM